MDQQLLFGLFEKVKNGEISIEEAISKLRKFPYDNIEEIVRLDNQRALRCGFPEVVLGTGKSIEQLLRIIDSILSQNTDLLITRLDEDRAKILLQKFPTLTYNPLAKTVTFSQTPKSAEGNVLVLSAGTADVPVAEEAVVTAEIMGAKVTRIFDVGVAGLHRLLDKIDLLQSANVLVVVAGMEGALPSVVAGLVSAPVIAVPTSVGYGASFGGITALLAMLNSCANGVSVVNIDNGFGAGYQAALINRQRNTDTQK